jgi:hypothetical protein
MPARKRRTETATLIVGLALVLGAIAAPSSRAAEVPSAATHIHIESYRNTFIGFWVLPENADAAVICYRAGGGPSSPAEASSCSPPGRWYAAVDAPGGWTPTAPAAPLEDFAVFSVVTAGPTYGPPARFTGEVPPPYPAEYLESTGISNTALDVSWSESRAFDANGGFPASGPGGTVEWLLYSTDGTRAPETSDAARLVAVVAQGADPTVVRVTELRRDAPYTFAVRGRDREGHLSPWSEPLTTAARRPGLSLLDNSSFGGRWHAATVPGSRDARDGAPLAASARMSRAHVGFTVSAPGARDEAQGARHVVRGPNGNWRAAALPAAWLSLEHLVLGPDGTLAGTALVGPSLNTCLVRRAPRQHWAVRRCLPAGWFEGVVVDARGRLHVLYTVYDFDHGSEAEFYATDARGRWVASELPAAPGQQSGGSLAFDTASNYVVMVSDGTRSVRVAWKRPRDVSFGPARRWPKPSGMGSFVPTSVASYGNRVTIGGLASLTCCADYRPYLLTGTRRGSRTSVFPITDVAVGNSGPLVAAPSRRTVIVGWRQAPASWNTRRQGIWSSQLRQDRRGHWSLTKAQQRTQSAFDWLQSVSTGAAGRAYFLVRRDH